MNNILFILGAGASARAGAPLMHNFLDVAQNLYATQKVTAYKEDFERVFKALSSLQKVHSKANLDLINIESVFTALEMANVLGKLPDHKSEEIPHIISSLKTVITITLEQTVKFKASERRITSPVPYEDFVNLIKFLKNSEPSQEISVITYNYDIALDHALYNAGLKAHYGFEGEVLGTNSIALMKLHGSLNWAEEETTNKIIPLYMNDYLPLIDTSYLNGEFTLNIGSQLAGVFRRLGKNVKADPVIVPPTFNKGEYQKAINSVWKNTANILKQADQIFILGYSQPNTDGLFPLLYALGTEGETRLKKFCVMNPDEDVKDRFYSMLGISARQRFEFYKYRFDRAITEIRDMYS